MCVCVRCVGEGGGGRGEVRTGDRDEVAEPEVEKEARNEVEGRDGTADRDDEGEELDHEDAGLEVQPDAAQPGLVVVPGELGQAQDLTIAWNSIKWSFLLALVVIYLLMCSLFESWSYPLIIMFTVPLAATVRVTLVPVQTVCASG